MIRNYIKKLNQMEMHFKNVFAYNVFGFTEPPRPMIEFIKTQLKNELIGVEIGVYKGDNSINILANLNIAKLFLIDPFLNYENYNDNVGTKNLNDVYPLVCKRFAKYHTKVTIIRDYSENVVNELPQLDFVYIDGNHQYDFVKNDIEMYYPKLRIGGVIGGHDIDNGMCEEHDGVVQAVIGFAQKHNLKLNIKSPDWWIVKEKQI